MTILLEKILAAFESTSQTSSRVSDNTSDEDDEEKLPKKIDDLLDIVKGLRREIAEFRADQNTIEVTDHLQTFFWFLNKFNFFLNLRLQTRILLCKRKNLSKATLPKLISLQRNWKKSCRRYQAVHQRLDLKLNSQDL